MAADVLNINKNKNFADLSIPFIKFQAFVQYLCVHLNLCYQERTIEVKLYFFGIKGNQSRKDNWYGIDYMNDKQLPHSSKSKKDTEQPKVRKPCRWDDKHLYLGPSFVENSRDYYPVVHFPTKCELLCQPRRMKRSTCKNQKPLKRCNCTNTDFCTTLIPHRPNRYGCRFEEEDDCEDEESDYDTSDEEPLELVLIRKVTIKTNRFGEGIEERCASQLFLPLPETERIHTKSTDLLFNENPRMSKSYDVIDTVREILLPIEELSESSDED